jgi:hypothetical protein
MLERFGLESHGEDFIRPEALAAENRHGSPPELVPPIGANDTVQALARVNSLAQTADKIDTVEVAAAVLKSMHYFPFQRFERRFHLYAGQPAGVGSCDWRPVHTFLHQTRRLPEVP